MSVYVDITKKLGDFTLKVKFKTNRLATALFGLSGSGKSVTLKCIAGTIKPDSGKIELNGKTLFDSEKNINLPPQKRNIGYLPQNYALFPNMSVKNNIYCGLTKYKPSQRKAICDEYIERFNLNFVTDLYPHQLSGGQQQRVALARALATKPKLLLLDEPFSALDAQLKLQLELDMIDLLKEFDGDIIFVSHNKDEIHSLCESVCVIENGVSSNVCDIEKVLINPTTVTQALLTGIENICEINNTGMTEFGFTLSDIKLGEYNHIAVSAKDIKFNCENSDVTFVAQIDNTIKVSSNNYLVLRVNKNAKPLLMSFTQKENFANNSKITVGINYTDIYYLK